MSIIVLLGRILYSSLFLIASLGHFTQSTIAFAESKGVPSADILVPLSGVIGILGALSVLLGYKARIGAWLLILFMVPITFMIHKFWQETEPAAAMNDQIMFLKNIAIIGGALVIAYFGSGPLSIDKRKRLSR